MKINWKFLAAVAAFLELTAAQKANAVIPYALRSSLMREFAFAPSMDFSKGLDASAIRPVESSRVTKSEDVAQVIPSNMKPTNDGSRVATQILDHSLSNWFNSEAVRSTSLGRGAHELEKSMQTDVSFGGTRPEETKHNLRFQMKATQTQAQVAYTGITNAQLTYFVSQNKTDLEVREPMQVLGTQLVLNHTIAPTDTRDIVSVRWNW